MSTHPLDLTQFFNPTEEVFLGENITPIHSTYHVVLAIRETLNKFNRFTPSIIALHYFFTKYAGQMSSLGLHDILGRTPHRLAIQTEYQSKPEYPDFMDPKLFEYTLFRARNKAASDKLIHGVHTTQIFELRYL